MTQRIIRLEGADPDITWDEVLDKPTTFTPSVHGHDWGEITNKPTTFTPSTHTHDWNTGVTSKPTTFPPSVHGHDWGEITNKPTTFTPSTHTHDWTGITSKPTTFPPSIHTHGIDQIVGQRTESITDLAADNNSGFYSSNVAANSPIAGAFFNYIICRQASISNYQFQLASRISDNTNFWIRALSVDGSIEPWQLIWNQGNLPNPLSEGALTSWTPTINSGNNAQFQGPRTGSYLKIGKFVFIHCSISAGLQAGQPTPTGNLSIGGFPFTFAKNAVALIGSGSGNGDGTIPYKVRAFETGSNFSLYRLGVAGSIITEAAWNWASAGTSLICDFSICGVVN